jgi:oligopeptide/dipeptide ABC transporter ATP-binding protein
METTVLDVENLFVRFVGGRRTTRAVNGICLTVRQGEIVGIVGESGSGKTATMLAILKLLPRPPAQIDVGRILFNGQDLTCLPESEMSHVRGGKVGMIFQDPMTSLNPVLRIGYQIMEPLIAHKGLSRHAARARAVELLQLVGIPDPERRLNDYPHRFSGGMRQRVMIAIALACEPNLLIADEPTTALDVTIQAQILELVKGLRRRLRMSMVWITHDLAVVAGLADRLVVMYAGYIVESGRVEEIYEGPLHPYTQALLAARPHLEGDPDQSLMPIPGSPPDLRTLGTGCPFASRCTYVTGRCLEVNPALAERKHGHFVACWADIATARCS